MGESKEMKIIIDGDIGKENLIKIGVFLTDLYHGKKEHINISFDGFEDRPDDEVLKIAEEMFGDKPHITMIIDEAGKMEDG